MPSADRLPVFSTLKPCCHAGKAKKSLTPPPLAPPLVPSFHTVSLAIEDCWARHWAVVALGIDKRPGGR